MRAHRGLPLWPLGLLVLIGTLQLATSGSPAYPTVRSGTQAVLVVIGLVVSCRAGLQRGVPMRDRWPWLFFIGFWVVQAATAVSMGLAYSGGPGQPPKSGPMLVAQILIALMAVPMMACLLSFPIPRLTPAQRTRFGLDLAAVCGGGFIALWYLVLAPALHSQLDSSRVISIVKPVLSLMLIFAACAMMMRVGVVGLRHPLTFLLLGNVMAAISLICFSVLAAHSKAPDQAWIQVAVQAPLALLIMAGVMQRRGIGRGVVRIGCMDDRRPTVLPYFALAFGYCLLLYAAFRSAPNPWIGLIVGAFVTTGAIAGRQIIALHENHNFVVRDTLTGLASRVALYDNLNRAVERTNRTGRPTAVLLIDLDGFKPVNDRLGHAVGDRLLVAVAGVLRDSVRSGDTVGRLGGDEFAVILPDVTDVATALQIAGSIAATCAEPFDVGGEPVTIGASIGVSITEPDKVVEGQELLRQADVAMYHIKRQRSDHEHVSLYDIGMDLDPASLPDPVALPGLDTAELAEYDRLCSRLAELEHKGMRERAPHSHQR